MNKLFFLLLALAATTTTATPVRLVTYGYTLVADVNAVHTGANVSSAYRYNAVDADEARRVVEGRDTAAGIDAALLEANTDGGIHGALFERYHVNGPPTVQTTDLAALAAPLRAASPSTIPGAIGITGLAHGYGIAADVVAREAGLGAFGNANPLPDAYNLTVSRHAIRIRSAFEAEAQLVIQYALQSALRCKRAVIFFPEEIVESRGVAASIQAQMGALGYPVPDPVVVSAAAIAADPAGFAANVTRVLLQDSELQRAQCIVALFDTSALAAFLGALSVVPGVRIGDYAVLAPSIVSSPEWHSVDGFAAGWYDRLYSTSHIPDPYDVRYTFSATFRAAMDALYATGYPRASTTRVQSGSATGDLGRWGHSYNAALGYLVGRLFVDACRATSSAAFTPSAVIDSIYRQKFFGVDDFALGPYNAGCSNLRRAAELPYPCECNVGSRKLFMTRVNVTSGLTEPLYDDAQTFQVGVAELTVASASCTPAIGQTQLPLIYASPSSTNAALEPGLARIHAAATAGLYQWVAVARSFSVSRDTDVDMIAIPISATAPNATYALDTLIPSQLQLQGYAAMALTPAELEAAKASRRPFMDVAPLRYRYALLDDPLPASMSDWDEYRLPLFPVVADLLNAAAKYIADGTSAGTQARIPRTRIIGDTNAVVAQAVRALEHYQASPPRSSALTLFDDDADAAATSTASSSVLAAFDAALASIGGEDIVIVASQNNGILERLLQHHASPNAAASNATVVIVASEFVLFDAIGVATAALATVPARWVYTSGIETWGEVDPPFLILDPADAYTAVIATLVYTVSGGVFSAVPSPADFAFRLYTERSHGPFLGRVTVGPLVNVSCAAVDAADSSSSSTTSTEHPGGECQCNKGITRFHARRLSDWVHALQRAGSGDLPAAIGYAAQPALATIDYAGCAFPLQPLASASTTFFDKAENIGIVSAAGVVAVLLLIVGAWRIGQRGKRDNSCAPKDSAKPFAMVFTDIQSSTTLWARAPEEMGPAVDAHHDIIRGIIARRGGYEVKTIGDSFMVAFQEAADAVAFACELQSAFVDYDWGSETFNELYRELIGPAFDAAPADADGWHRRDLWNGLRVRVGVHYGMGDIKLDPVSQGYDYYGTVVNTAARVEGVAHGGQIAITAAVVDALTDGGRRTLEGDLGFAAHDFGPQPLRGLDEPIGLTQILPARFGDRIYAPLRLDVEATVIHSDEDDDENDDPVATKATGGGMLGVAGNGSFSDAASVASFSAQPATQDDLAFFLLRRGGAGILGQQHASADRTKAVENTMRMVAGIETMLALLPPKNRRTTVDLLVDKWRIAPLRKQPGMRRFRKRLPADDVDMVLLAHRIGIAADTRRTQQAGSDIPEESAGRPLTSTTVVAFPPTKQDPVHADGGPTTAFAALVPAPTISIGRNDDNDDVEDM